MEGRGRGAFGASPSMMAMMFFLFVGYLALFDGRMTIPMANAVFHGKNLPKTFSNNSTHSQPLTFQQYLQQQKGGVGMSLVKGTRPEDLIVEDYSEEEMDDQKVDIENYERQKQAFMDAINSGKQIPVTCETEIRDGKRIFTKCMDVFPIESWKGKDYNEKTHQIGPFPVPRFPLHKKCSPTNPSTVPPTKLTITPAIYMYTTLDKDNAFFCQSNDLYICYASAFEGGTNMNLWELLKLENIRGNKVAIMCNKNDNNHGIKWHGIHIVRKYRNENILEYINGKKVVKRYTFRDTIEFSYSGKRIKLSDGEFFHQLILTEKGLEIFTSRRNIYMKEDNITRTRPYGLTRSYIEYSPYDPEEGRNFSKRADLTDIDLSSAQRIYFAFNYNASLWSLPFDIAIMDPSKYNVSIEGIPNVQNLKISAMKVVYNRTECHIKPKYNIRDKFSKFEATYAFLKNKTNEIYNKMFAWPDEMKYAKTQITKEEYDYGMMTAKLTCLNGEVAYGWFKFNPHMTVDKIEPQFDYTNDFAIMNGCKHIAINLLSNFGKDKTHLSLGAPEPEYTVEKFFVGLSSNVSGFELTQEEIKIFKIFDDFIQKEDFIGQSILGESRVYEVLKVFKLNAKFRQLKMDFMKTFVKDSDNSWTSTVGEFGLFQEIYECPNFRVNLPRLSGKIKFTFINDQGKINTDFFGYSTKNKKINFIDSYTISSTTLGETKCTIKDVFEFVGSNIYRKGDGNCHNI